MHQDFERILYVYVYKTENTSIRLLDGRVLLGSLLDNRVRAGLPMENFQLPRQAIQNVATLSRFNF